MRLLAVLALVAAPALADPPRDPFAPYGHDAVDETRNWPLADVDVGALRLEGTIVGVASPTAMLAGPDGRGVNVKVGALIGREGAQVKAIRRDKVIAEVTLRDGIGRVFARRVEIAPTPRR